MLLGAVITAKRVPLTDVFMVVLNSKTEQHPTLMDILMGVERRKTDKNAQDVVVANQCQWNIKKV